MIRLVSLFSNQKQADQAVNALADADLGDHDIQVLNEWTAEMERDFQLLPVSNPASALSGVIGPRSRSGEILDDASMGDTAEFFKRSVERGGLIVAVDVSNDDYRKRVESILDNQDAVAVSVAT